ncbi:tyrosine-type recombinase/integrase [Chloroflexota bacterium]
MKTLKPSRSPGNISPTLDSLMTLYRLSNQSEGKSPDTVTWYTDILKAYESFTKAQLRLDDLTGFSINAARQYILYLRGKPKYADHPFIAEKAQPVSPKTVQCHVRAMKAFSTWLYLEGYTQQNILQHLKMPKAPTKLIEPLTPHEINKILISTNKKTYCGERNHALLVTLLDSGLRSAEAASITLDNLNLKDGYIKVIGKGAKERIVPIGKFVQMELMHYIEKTRPQPTSGGYKRLFLSRGGNPITRNTLKLVFSRVAKESGVKRLHAHLCRHTFAINYLLNGGDIFSLKNILGHTSLDMVNHYLHFTSTQITAQHRKYSPMDKLQKEEAIPS